MPLGSPQGPSDHAYSLTFRSQETIDGYPVEFRVSVSTEYPGDAAVPAIVQSFVDVVHASSDFALVFAERTTKYSENLTPSPEV
jgi:hypothetical protein